MSCARKLAAMILQTPGATCERRRTRHLPVARPLHKRVAHLLRRVHLFLGLFLLPWAVLYGVTAFLFNHPAAFSDNPTVQFAKEPPPARRWKRCRVPASRPSR